MFELGARHRDGQILANGMHLQAADRQTITARSTIRHFSGQAKWAQKAAYGGMWVMCLKRSENIETQGMV